MCLSQMPTQSYHRTLLKPAKQRQAGRLWFSLRRCSSSDVRLTSWILAERQAPAVFLTTCACQSTMRVHYTYDQRNLCSITDEMRAFLRRLNTSKLSSETLRRLRQMPTICLWIRSNWAPRVCVYGHRVSLELIMGKMSDLRRRIFKLKLNLEKLGRPMLPQKARQADLIVVWKQLSMEPEWHTK